MTSDMIEFEKQLNSKNEIIQLDLDDSKLKTGELNSIDIDKLIDDKNKISEKINTEIGNNNNKNLIKVTKNVVLSFISDFSGVGYVRNWQVFTMLNFVFGRTNRLQTIISPTFLTDQHLLVRAKTLYFQRSYHQEQLPAIRKYKEVQSSMKYSMKFELDDNIFFEDDARTISAVPRYNFGHRGITPQVQAAAIEAMSLMDMVIVSTEHLKHCINNELGIKTEVKVVPNIVAKSYHLTSYDKHITTKIKRPSFIINSSPTHHGGHDSSLPPDIRFGDFVNEAWRNYVSDGVLNDKIDIVFLGGLPYFWDHLKDKPNVKVMEWIDSVQYPYVLKEESRKAQFLLMPLIPNKFNYSKSDLKAIEGFAAGLIPIGSYFPDKDWKGPYEYLETKLPWDMKIQDLEAMIDRYSEPSEYNRVLDWQFNYMEENGRYLESPKFINEFVKLL